MVVPIIRGMFCHSHIFVNVIASGSTNMAVAVILKKLLFLFLCIISYFDLNLMVSLNVNAVISPLANLSFYQHCCFRFKYCLLVCFFLRVLIACVCFWCVSRVNYISYEIGNDQPFKLFWKDYYNYGSGSYFSSLGFSLLCVLV